jgi:hypothetical protein
MSPKIVLRAPTEYQVYNLDNNIFLQAIVCCYGHKTEYLILNLFAAAVCTTQLEDLQPLAVIKPGVSGESEMDLLSVYHWAEHEQQIGSMLLDGTAIKTDLSTFVKVISINICLRSAVLHPTNLHVLKTFRGYRPYQPRKTFHIVCTAPRHL